MACKNITSIFFSASFSLHMIIGYPWPTYIRSRVTYHLPLTQSLKNCISIASYFTAGHQYAYMLHMHWQLMRMRVHREKKRRSWKKKHVISRIRTCDLLTWSQQLFCIDTRTFSPAIRTRSPTDTNIQASKHASKQKFLHQTP